jgi:hypothetical protein
MSEDSGMRLMLDILVQIIISALIFFVVFAYIYAIYNDDYFEKEYLAKDIALEIEAIQVPQGNSVISYTKDTNDYDFFFRDNGVEVFEAVDQKEPAAYLKAISTFALYDNMHFRYSEPEIIGLKVKPVLLKTDNKISALLPGEDYSLGLYYINKFDISGEQKNHIFFSDSKDENFTGYVKAAAEAMNAGFGAGFSYSQTNYNFLISESEGSNIIYAPATKEKRKLAAIIANKLIEGAQDCLILPSYDDKFRMKIKKNAGKDLPQLLKDSFEEYYKNG